MNEENETEEMSCEESVGFAIALCDFTVEEFLEKLKGDTNE